jgi:hypothetical protein
MIRSIRKTAVFAAVILSVGAVTARREQPTLVGVKQSAMNGVHRHGRERRAQGECRRQPADQVRLCLMPEAQRRPRGRALHRRAGKDGGTGSNGDKGALARTATTAARATTATTAPRHSLRSTAS